eukprot:jgi/Chlat1/7218/Chrsp57S09132
MVTTESPTRGKDIAATVLTMLAGLVTTWMAASWFVKQLDPTQKTAKQAAARRQEVVKRLGRPNVKMNAYEDVVACDVVSADQLSTTFADIGGLEDVKNSLIELAILPLQRPELFHNHGLLSQPPRGALLFGPPGKHSVKHTCTGKTALARALAKESGACFINVRLSSLQSKWFGDAQKLAAAVFSLAAKLQPSIVFIDEADGLLGSRRGDRDHEAVTAMRTEFLSCWDGLLTDREARVLVLAATNRPFDLDEAALRRLPRAFHVILQGEHIDKDVDYEELAALTEGHSGSDLAELCRSAAYAPVRELLEQERSAKAPTSSSSSSSSTQRHAVKVLRALRQSDFMEALKSSSPTIELAKQYKMQSKQGQEVDMNRFLAFLQQFNR